MKEIRIVLDDQVYKKLIKDKGVLTWKQFLLCKGEIEDGKNKEVKRETSIGT